MAGGRKERKSGEQTVRTAADILTEYSGFIRGVIRFQSCNSFDEEDLFQEFFLVLVRRSVPPNVRSIKSYLYKAVLHHVLDLVRRQASYQRNLQKYAKEVRISINNRTPESAFINREQRNAALAYLVRHLQEREAEAFMLRYRDNCSITEIAAKMGVEKRTVSRYLSEGLRRLQATLAIE